MKLTQIFLSMMLALLVGACAINKVEPGEPTEADKYMAEVENAADRTGADVLWVNPPKEKDKDKNGG